MASFNSRARKGRDLKPRQLLAMPSCFNSRARKGRDRVGEVLVRDSERFNSRARKGRDLSTPFASTILVPFQFTRPQGARHRDGVFTIPAQEGFNSRARKGRDSDQQRAEHGERVSIHAPARGATLRTVGACAHPPFQFTRPQGARLSLPAMSLVMPRFQFTRPQGARRGV